MKTMRRYCPVAVVAAWLILCTVASAQVAERDTKEPAPKTRSFSDPLTRYTAAMLEVEQRRLEKLVHFLDQRILELELEAQPVHSLEGERAKSLKRLVQVLALKSTGKTRPAAELQRKVQMQQVEIMVLRDRIRKLGGADSAATDAKPNKGDDANFQKWWDRIGLPGSADEPLLDRKQVQQLMDGLDKRRQELLQATDVLRRQLEEQLGTRKSPKTDGPKRESRSR